MHSIVCIKQVPNTNNVRIDQKTGTLIREGVESIINPDDRHALEAALALKDLHGGTVTVLTMGPLQAEVALREALAMGCDRALLLTDRAFAGADTWATSTTLAAAIRKLGEFSFVFCGHQAIDGDTAQVGPQLARHLGMAQSTLTTAIALEGDAHAIATRTLESETIRLRCRLPLLVTCTHTMNSPRYPSAAGIFSAFRRPIERWGVADLGLSPESIGLKGSPTQVVKSFVPVVTRESRVLQGDLEKSAALVVAELATRGLLPERK